MREHRLLKQRAWWRVAAGIVLTGAAAGTAAHARGVEGQATTRAQEATPFSQAQMAALDQASAQGLDYVPGEVVFKFKKNTFTVSQQRALTAIRSHPTLNDVHWTNDIGVIHDDTQPDGRVLAQQLAEQGEVEFAQPNYIRHIGPEVRRMAPSAQPFVSGTSAPSAVLKPNFSTLIPNDPFYAQFQWNFPLTGIPDAWGINPGASSSVLVAVIDTGVTGGNFTINAPLWNGTSFTNASLLFARSPDFGASRLVNGRDFVFNTSSNIVLDMDGHATHVAGTIGEDTNNGVGLAGIAFNVQIMPIKVCIGYWESMIQRGVNGVTGFSPMTQVGCSDSAIVSGINAAVAAGAKVINISLGGTQPSPSIQAALQSAVAAGTFVALAAGNDAQSGNPTEYPAFYAPQFDGVMAVAAITSTKAHAAYSSTGSYIEIAAPGGDGNDPTSPNSWVSQATLFFSDQDQSLVVPRFDRYAVGLFAGTSMASPHVAGLAALIISQYPGIKPAAVEALIKRTALNLGDKTIFGAGMIQARAALLGQGIAK